MEGRNTRNWSIEPNDDRDEDNSTWEIREVLSCSNTGFGGKDPATIEEPTGTPAEIATFPHEEPTTEVEG